MHLKNTCFTVLIVGVDAIHTCLNENKSCSQGYSEAAYVRNILDTTSYEHHHNFDGPYFFLLCVHMSSLFI